MKAICFLCLLSLAIARSADEEKPPGRPGLQINAEYAELHLKENRAYYSNNVVVVDPPAKQGDAPTIIRCHEMTAIGKPGKIDSIVALTGVQIDQGDNHARGNKAVYTGTNELMVLTGAFDPADTNHTRPYLYSLQGATTADMIIYDRLNDKLFGRGGVRTEIAAGILSKTNQSGFHSIQGTNKSRTQKPQSPPADK